MSESLSIVEKMELLRKAILDWPQLRQRPVVDGMYGPLINEANGRMWVFGEEIIQWICRHLKSRPINEGINTEAIRDFIDHRTPSSHGAAIKALTKAIELAPRVNTEAKSTALDLEGEIVLRFLAENPRTRFSVLKICTGLKRKLAEKTIRQRVNLLIEAGLAERKDGPKKGVAVTEAGKAHCRELHKPQQVCGAG